MISCCCSLAGTKACETCSNHQMIWKQIGYRLPKDLDKKLHTPEPHKDETMDDLISRQAAVEVTDAIWTVTGDKNVVKVWQQLKELPSAQPERKKGKWLLSDEQRREDTDNGNYLFFCSNCLRSDVHAKTQEVPFCWWCGSDMRGEQE